MDFSVDLVARAWSRMTPTAEVSTEVFQAFLEKAQRVGFLRDAPSLSRFVEAP
jgi:NitT/TauT family transport system substrate-binding protein